MIWRTHLSHSATRPCLLIITPVPAIDASRGAAPRMAASSSRKVPGSTPLTPATRSSVNGSTAALRPHQIVGIRRFGQLGLVGSVAQQFADQPGEDLVVGSGTELKVAIGQGGRLGPTWVQHPDLAAGPPELSQPHHGIGEGRSVAVGDDGIGPEEDQQA